MSYIEKEELVKRMQVDAPMNWTDTDFELGEEWQYKSDMEVIESCAEVNAIPIPPRATNGDMIKALFPNSIVCEPIVEDDIIHVVFADKTDSAIGFDYSWWNAPYNPQQNLSYTDKSGANIASQDVFGAIEKEG